MSQENVEIVRRVFAEMERGNFSIPQFFDPGVRVKWLDAVGAESETVGLQAMGQFMTDWLEVAEDMVLAAERIIDAGDQVVVFSVWRGR
ncbi:MAG: nuclear transport factor 2 family protein, partial [Thermoleophilaceae bacterium]|nr:nuclear transport factor 2 family protein [Thermoleophilaceae bacterium]